MKHGLAILEIGNFTPALVALDALDKAADIRLEQMELNDFNGMVLKISGDSSSLRAAVAAAQEQVAQMQGKISATVIDSPSPEALKGINSGKETSPLLNAATVYFPDYQRLSTISKAETTHMPDMPFAIGLIETQGFTAVMEAIDTACKAANVEILGKEKLGGGYITILIKGDVAAVKAAIDAGKEKVNGLGKLIAAHVIARPSPAILSLFPKV
ncbi:MAG: BMC domain-containing protein [Planctomycetota bacterium]|nr:BMC domain-containing protein [Planctomycetota bacterium]